MKRLLAYLFIVLGLGLTFGVSVKANLSVYDPNNVKENSWRKNLAAQGTSTEKNMDENVSQKAAEQGREQNPSLAGDPDKVLISYR